MVMMWYKKAIRELFQACALNKRCGPWPHFQNEGFWILVLLVQALFVYLSNCALLTTFRIKKVRKKKKVISTTFLIFFCNKEM